VLAGRVFTHEVNECWKRQCTKQGGEQEQGREVKKSGGIRYVALLSCSPTQISYSARPHTQSIAPPPLPRSPPPFLLPLPRLLSHPQATKTPRPIQTL
jgi:hypothetical protein